MHLTPSVLPKSQKLVHNEEMDSDRRPLGHRLQPHHGIDDHGTRDWDHRPRARHE